MKRAAGLLVTLALMAGCASPNGMGGYPGGGMAGGPGDGGCLACNTPPTPPPLKGAVGPWGEAVRVQPPVGPHAPGAMGLVGPEVTQASMPPGFGGFPGPVHPGMPGALPPNAIPPMPPGMMPPGMMPPGMMPPGMMPPGAGVMQAANNAVVQAQAPAPAGPAGFPCARSQVRFVGPAGGKIGWYVPGPASREGKPVLLPHQLDLPGRYNFLQASIYRLKLSDIPGRPGLELYPSLEVVPGNPKTEAFLAHNFIPVEFTEEDFDQVTAGNYITKVIYLPDAQYQTPVDGGVDTLVSTRLEPGQDPCAEAQKRGHILLVVRVGGIDLESANSPALDSPGPFGTPKPVPVLVPSGPAPTPPAGGGTRPPTVEAAPPTLPGIANPVPSGAPSAPPVTSAPPAPKFSAPTEAPAGPMVPADPSTLPPMPTIGGQSKAKTSSGIQQATYQLGSDGRRYPAAVPPVKEARYPLTSIPTGAKSRPTIEDEDGKARRGLLDGFWGN
jgi:hypothetical protein